MQKEDVFKMQGSWTSWVELRAWNGWCRVASVSEMRVQDFKRRWMSHDALRSMWSQVVLDLWSNFNAFVSYLDWYSGVLIGKQYSIWVLIQVSLVTSISLIRINCNITYSSARIIVYNWHHILHLSQLLQIRQENFLLYGLQKGPKML